MPLGVRTVVLGLLNGEQGVPMGGAPHVYLRRVGNGLMYCMRISTASLIDLNDLSQN